MERDPYEILGIARDATLREASAAYRRLAELYHPDRLREFRADVQEEGARHLREANVAIRVLRSRLRGPLVAPGHERRHEHHDTNADDSGNGSGAIRPARERRVPPTPSDDATAAAARICYVVLRAVDAPDFQARWAGPHAAATLHALKDGHRLDGGPIRQVEWGTYAALLEGDATRRLLERVLPDDEWRSEPVQVVTMAGDRSTNLPARFGDGGGTVTLDAVVCALDDETWYEVLADAY